MESIKVVCGIIRKDGKILIARRKPEKDLGGYWEFPGGKIESGEDPEKALERELQEELGMSVSNLRYFGVTNHQYETFNIELIAYTCDFQKASFNLKDHEECLFISIESFCNFKIAPADIPFVKCLESNLG